MYNVVLADDDFPVLELLTGAIDWEGLGMRLVGAYENGLQAWEHAQNEMPDILITDIGMPKLDGLELIKKIKEVKSNVRVIILSCHDEFQYARSAMRMNVQDYLLKDAFDPADLERLLLQFKLSLDEEKQSVLKQSHLTHMVNETMELRKEQWLKGLMHQPLLSEQQAQVEAARFGVLQDGEACLPVMGFIAGYRQAKKRFVSDQTLRFAVNNVLGEMQSNLSLRMVHVGYSNKETFFLFAYRPDLRHNIHQEVADSLKEIDAALNKVLKVRMSFLTEHGCTTAEGLKQQLSVLLASEAQRFYLQEGAIEKRTEFVVATSDLFASYDQASTEIREALHNKRADSVSACVDRWCLNFQTHRFKPESVKDWVLKLLLDLKLKLQSLQFIFSGVSADTLHKEIGDIDSLPELQRWLTEHFMNQLALMEKGAGTGGVRSEVMKACHYVSLHLDKKVSLEEVAEHLFLNPSYFSRLFKKEIGLGFIEYVTQRKMERAKELLNQTEHSVGKICEMLGYDNHSYFIKTFKAHNGVTPADYRG